MDIKPFVALDKDLKSALPTDRKYTKLEAMFSLTCDWDKGNSVSVAGYSKVWKWARATVKKFIDDIGLVINYPENVKNKQNQRGKIMLQITDRSLTDDLADDFADDRQIKAIPPRRFRVSTDRSLTDDFADDQQNTDRSLITTIKPKPKPKPKPNIYSEKRFPDFWEMYPQRNGRKIGKQKAKDQFLKLKDLEIDEVMIATQNYAKECGGLPKDAFRYLRDKIWKDYLEAVSQKELQPQKSTKSGYGYKEGYSDRSIADIRKSTIINKDGNVEILPVDTQQRIK